VDVVDLQGKPLTRANNERLTGVTRDDIREAMSRRKKALNVAKEARKTSRLLLHTPASAAIAAQRDRAHAEQQAVTRPEPPTTVQAVRPDLAADVEKLVSEAASKGVQSGRERRSGAVNFADINAALGFGASGGEGGRENDNRPDADDVAAILAGQPWRMDDHADMEIVNDGDDGPTPVDAYDILGTRIA
jgi:hypothetical protein